MKEERVFFSFREKKERIENEVGVQVCPVSSKTLAIMKYLKEKKKKKTKKEIQEKIVHSMVVLSEKMS